MNKIYLFFLFIFGFFYTIVAQTPCVNPTTSNCIDAIAGSSKFYMTTSGNVDFVFDENREYVTGITQSGKTMLRLKVDSVPLNPNCRWKLIMYIDNNSVLPANEWESLVLYGNSGKIPELNLIEVKVYNGCGTPLQSGIFQVFTNNTQYDILDIIPGTGFYYPGECNHNPVNTTGSFLTDYNEFNFIIDYRINPSYVHRPGAYQIKIHFCLVEV
jgi:hypothetical protein